VSDWSLVITGCGTSHGNPAWGRPERWSTDPRDARRRSGALLLGPSGEVVLIDVGPDLAWQLRDPYCDWDGLSYPARCITRCDAVLLTHDHADHCHGMNELRHLNRLMDGAEIPIYGLDEHLSSVQQMFGYCFGGDNAYSLANPALRAAPMAPHTSHVIAGLPVTCFPMSHGLAGTTAGFRIADIAYLTDLKSIPEEGYAQLTGLELLVLDMLRDEIHPTHLNWEEACAVIERLQPASVVLTHMGHEVFYAEWEERLPENVTMAYDGLVRSFSAGMRQPDQMLVR
jgi:phosphoribosyl 1,2-cyclic phosphate phosphodiesterase